MNCLEVRAWLLEGEEAPSDELAAHLRTCPLCTALSADGFLVGRALAATARTLMASPASELVLQAEIVQRCVQRERGVRAWLRSRPTRLRVFLAVLLVALLALVQLVLVRRADWSVYPGVRMALICGVYFVGAALALRAHLRAISYRGLSARLRWVFVFLLLALPTLIAALPAASGQPVELLGLGSRDFAWHAGACLVYGSLSTVPLAVLTWLLERSAALCRGQLFPIGAAGLAANLLLQVHCHITSPAHLLLGHAAISWVWALALLLRSAAPRRSPAS